MSHDKGNPFSKETGEYLQEITEAPVIESDLNSTPEAKADELEKQAKELEGKVATKLNVREIEQPNKPNNRVETTIVDAQKKVSESIAAAFELTPEDLQPAPKKSRKRN
jgi:hypothetical protein